MGYSNKGLVDGVEPELTYEEVQKAQYDPIPHRRPFQKKQVSGTHYSKHNIQVWDIVDEYGLDFYKGNVLKYLLRNKMDVYEDMLKAQHYVEKWLEVHSHLRN